MKGRPFEYGVVTLKSVLESILEKIAEVTVPIVEVSQYVSLAKIVKAITKIPKIT